MGGCGVLARYWLGRVTSAGARLIMLGSIWED
jgi:hypothetical protein